MQPLAACLRYRSIQHPGGSGVAGEELADGDILCPKLWPVSGQALSQPHRWAWALRAAWPWQLLKVVFYRAKFPPTVVPPAVHTEHIHLQVGRHVTAHSSLSEINFLHGKQNHQSEGSASTEVTLMADAPTEPCHGAGLLEGESEFMREKFRTLIVYPSAPRALGFLSFSQTNLSFHCISNMDSYSKGIL